MVGVQNRFCPHDNGVCSSQLEHCHFHTLDDIITHEGVLTSVQESPVQVRGSQDRPWNTQVMVMGWDEQSCLRPLRWRGYLHTHTSFLLEAQTSGVLNLPSRRSNPNLDQWKEEGL